MVTAPPTLIKKRARVFLKRLDFFEGSSELLANLLQFSQTLKVTHLLVAWDMTICGVHVCAHSIHWRLPRKIKGCNLVIKKRRHCMGLGEPLPSGRGWLPSLQECRRLRISASSYFRISLRLKGRLYWLVTFLIYPTCRGTRGVSPSSHGRECWRRRGSGECTTQMPGNLWQFIQTFKVTRMLVAWDMIVSGPQLSRHYTQNRRRKDKGLDRTELELLNNQNAPLTLILDNCL